mmetsp:Transcript_100748/g.325148  ORF Transcript_100748/g.325148 Transcript_100748/m.325148 type:complete len:220 (+) Transcript_100748:296-955(+)
MGRPIAEVALQQSVAFDVAFHKVLLQSIVEAPFRPKRGLFNHITLLASVSTLLPRACSGHAGGIWVCVGVGIGLPDAALEHRPLAVRQDLGIFVAADPLLAWLNAVVHPMLDYLGSDRVLVVIVDRLQSECHGVVRVEDVVGVCIPGQGKACRLVLVLGNGHEGSERAAPEEEVVHAELELGHLLAAEAHEDVVGDDGTEGVAHDRDARVGAPFSGTCL